MKSKQVTIRGKEYHLLYNGAAFFALQDKEDMIRRIMEDFDYLYFVINLLSEQGELMRRYEGHAPGEMLHFQNGDELKLLLSYMEIVTLQRAAIDAVMSGMGREIEEEQQERDISLEKFKKKPDKKTQG